MNAKPNPSDTPNPPQPTSISPLLWLKRNWSRLCAGLLLGSLPMLLSGCFTMATIASSKPLTIDRTYKVDEVTSALKQENGDIVISAKGRLTEETEQPKLTLLITAREIQAAREAQWTNTGKTTSFSRATISATRSEERPPGAGAGEKLPILITPEEIKNWRNTAQSTAAIQLVTWPTPREFHDRIGITYHERLNDGTFLGGTIEPDAVNIQKPRRQKLWWLALAIPADVVLLPVEVVGGVIVAAVVVSRAEKPDPRQDYDPRRSNDPRAR